MPENNIDTLSATPLCGLVLATVLSNYDENNKGCLKIQLIREGGQQDIFEGVRVLSSTAGSDYGEYLLPEVGEQVLVGFLDGSPDHPVVLGSLYSRKDLQASKFCGKENPVKRLKTKGGVLVEISDEKNNETITIKTPGKLLFEMKQKDETITLMAGRSSIVIDDRAGKVHVKGDNAVSLECGAASLSLSYGGAVEVKGSAIKLNSSGNIDLKGRSTTLNGSSVEIKSDGVLSLKGIITKIN